MQIKINNRIIDLTPELLDQASVKFSFSNGRKFTVRKDDIKITASLSEWMEAVGKGSFKTNDEKQKFIQVFKNLREKGYNNKKIKASFIKLFIQKHHKQSHKSFINSL